MKFPTGVCSIIFVFLICVVFIPTYGNEASSHYTNTWAVHIPNVDQAKVHEIARRHGMINLGQVGFLLYIICLRVCEIIAICLALSITKIPFINIKLKF